MEEREISIIDIVEVFLSKKLLIISITSFVAVVSIIIVLFIDNIYKSETTLSPVDSSNKSLANSSLGGIASMAGINLGSGSSDKVEVSIEFLKSRKFHNHLLSFPGVLPKLMASKSFDRKKGILIFNSDIYISSTNSWLDKKKPSALKAHQVILNQLKVSKNPDTGIVRISFQHISPVFAKEFLDLVLREFNTLSAAKDLDEIKKSLLYLNKKYAQSDFIEIKSSINKIIEQQMKNQMLIKSREYYIFDIIDPPFTPEEKFEPNRSQIVIFMTLFGAFSSLLFVLIHFIYSEEKR